MFAKANILLLLSFLFITKTAFALDVQFNGLVKHESTVPDDPWSGVPLSQSGGNVYISDKAVGVKLYVSSPIDGDSIAVNFIDPDGVIDQQKQLYSVLSDSACWWNPNNYFDGFTCYPDVHWQFYTTDVNYGKTGTWVVEILKNDQVIQTENFDVIPRSLRKTGGDGQTIVVADDGSIESQPLSVQLIDYDGSTPYKGETVNFAIESSPKGSTSGSITPATPSTNANGIASVNFTPGSKAGAYVITATTRSAPNTPQTFNISVELPSSQKGKTKDPLVDLDLPKNHGGSGSLICQASPMAGNPINLGTGNKYQHEIDYVSADNFPLIFDRHYNSDSPADSVLGGYWRGSYDRTIITYKVGKARLADVYRANGKVFTFKLNNGVWQGDADINDQLIKTATGWRYILKNNHVEEYDANGKLIKLMDRNELPQQLTYNEAGQLIQVSSSFGPVLTFTYNSTGLLASMMDSASNMYTYFYDALGNLIRVEYPDASSRQYRYENIAFPHALTGIIDENSVRFATWRYDELGRAVSSEHAGGVEKIEVSYNSDGSRIVTDTLGQIKTHFVKNILGTAKVSGFDTRLCPTCELLDGAKFNYDNNGFPIKTTDGNGNIDYLAFNRRGLLISRTDAAGTADEQTRTQIWHETLNLPSASHESGKSTYYSYDDNGNVLEMRQLDTATNETQIWTYSYNPLGLIETIDGPRTEVNDITHYYYYPNGRLWRIVNALGHALEILEYDANGRPTKLQEPNSVITTLAYDPRGRLISQNAGGEMTTYSYDLAGRLIQTTLPDQSSTTFEYDEAGRQVRKRDHWHNEIRYHYDNNSHLINQSVYSSDGALQQHSWSYDQTGKLISSTGAEGQATHYSYDKKGNLIGVTDAKSQLTSYNFDALDRPVTTQYPDTGVVDKEYDKQNNLVAVTDAEGHTTNYHYNGLGQIIETDSPDAGISTYRYDEGGNLVNETRANGKTISYQYDALNRLTKTIDSGGSTITYQYDNCSKGIGRLCGITGNGFNSSWRYDDQGRVTARQEVSGGLNFVIDYQYNALGQLSGISYPSGKTISFNYLGGRLNNVAVNGETILNQVSYNAAGQVSGWNWDNGDITLRSYNQDGRLIQQTVADADRNLTYDPVGNILSIDEGISLFAYDYDPMDRLIGATADSYNLSYGYDRNGNRLTEDNGVSLTEFHYNPANNQLTETQGPAPKNYQYDEVGNALSDGQHNFSYDAKNQLIAVAGLATYSYNGLGQRIAKTVNGIQTHYAYDENSRLIGEYNATGQAIQETIYLFGQPIAVLKGESIYNVHADHLGSPRKITDQTGHIVWQWQDKPFGDSPVNQDPDGDGIVFDYNLRFPGQYFDEETGLHYNYFRYYDPSTGRYITSDPIGLWGGLNTYLYANANPTKYIDPTGNVAIADDAIIGGTIAVGACIATNCTKPISDAIENTLDAIKELCEDEPECDPPAGTQCYEYNSGHQHKGYDPHYHIWQQNPISPGNCRWNKRRSRRDTYDANEPPPPGLRPCESYPSWVKQEGK